MRTRFRPIENWLLQFDIQVWDELQWPTNREASLDVSLSNAFIASQVDYSSSCSAESARSSNLVDAINAYLGNSSVRSVRTPAQIGALEGYQRRRVLNSALILSIAKVLRSCNRRSARVTAFLVYVALKSDNQNARCTDSAARIGKYLNCGEDVVRDIRDELLKCGALLSEDRMGMPTAVWLPYVEAALSQSDFSIVEALAPPARPRGRPRTTSKTLGAMHPTFLEEGIKGPPHFEKGRVSNKKTSGIVEENPGPLRPDCKISTQDLIAKPLRTTCQLADSCFSNSEISEGAGRLLHALKGQAFGAIPKDHESLTSWCTQLDRNPLVRNLSEEDAFSLAATVRLSSPWWPAPALLNSMIEDHAKKLNRRAAQRTDYNERWPRFLEWQRQLQIDTQIREEVCRTVPYKGVNGKFPGDFISERLRDANIDLRQFENDRFDKPENRPRAPSDDPVPFTYPSSEAKK